MNSRIAYRLFVANLKKDARNSCRYIRLDPLAEGLALSAFRLLWIPFVLYHFLVFLPCVTIIGFALLWPLRKQEWSAPRAAGFFYLVVDLYIGLWTTGVILAYAACYVEVARQLAGGRGDWTHPAIILPTMAASLRLYELWSFLGCLHSQKKYMIYNVRRAIINTFWHYVEAIFAFATLYLLIALRFGDPFSATAKSAIEPGGIAANWINPLYFSAISIATVGFGDFAPQTTPGKALVMTQVFFGVFLLVIVLQRAMSSEEMITHPRGEGASEGTEPDEVPY